MLLVLRLKKKIEISINSISIQQRIIYSHIRLFRKPKGELFYKKTNRTAAIHLALRLIQQMLKNND